MKSTFFVSVFLSLKLSGTVPIKSKIYFSPSLFTNFSSSSLSLDFVFEFLLQ